MFIIQDHLSFLKDLVAVDVSISLLINSPAPMVSEDLSMVVLADHSVVVLAALLVVDLRNLVLAGQIIQVSFKVAVALPIYRAVATTNLIVPTMVIMARPGVAAMMTIGERRSPLDSDGPQARARRTSLIQCQV